MINHAQSQNTPQKNSIAILPSKNKLASNPNNSHIEENINSPVKLIGSYGMTKDQLKKKLSDMNL